MSGLVLSSFTGDFRALKALIAAQYNGVEIATPEFVLNKDNVTAEFKAKNPSGKVPMLETPHGVLFESNAIARYVARIRRDTELTGRNFFESGQVDAWVDFASHDVEFPATLWIYPILGWSQFNAKVHEDAVANLTRALGVLEGHLLSRTYMVGESITLADIVMVCALFYPFKLVLDGSWRESYPSVTRWFYTCVNQPQFAAVIGDVPLCEKAMTAGGAAAAAPAAGAGKKAAAKAEKPKAEKAEKPKAEKKAAEPKAAAPAPAPVAEVKEEKKGNPLLSLPKSPMDLDEWKRTYSNTKPHIGAMPWFWEHLDKAGYSLWQQKYKYNAENKRDFMTSNLVGGFIQRTDELRRFAFGNMFVLNTEAPYEVEGCWMIRGQDIAPMLDCNPDAEYYEWIKLDADNTEHQKLVAQYWCEEEKLFGKTVYDARIFK